MWLKKFSYIVYILCETYVFHEINHFYQHACIFYTADQYCCGVTLIKYTSSEIIRLLNIAFTFEIFEMLVAIIKKSLYWIYY